MNTENEKTSYDILWYLNEYPNEVNATDEVISGSLKIDKHDYQKVKSILLKDGLIKQRSDNRNNIAWTLTDAGQEHFNKLKNEFKTANPLALEKDEQLKDVQIAYFISKTESNKKADKKMYIGFAVGIIGTLLAAMLPEMLKKIPKEKEEIIQVNVSTHNAAIDTVFVQTDTIKKK